MDNNPSIPCTCDSDSIVSCSCASPTLASVQSTPSAPSTSHGATTYSPSNSYYPWAAPSITRHAVPYPAYMSYYGPWNQNTGTPNPYYPQSVCTPAQPPQATTQETTSTRAATPLGNATSAAVNVSSNPPRAPATGSEQPSSTSRKRKSGTNSGPANTRRRRTDENTAPVLSTSTSATQPASSVPVVAVHGAGPQPQPHPVSPPAAPQSHGSLTAKSSAPPKQEASHVWFFVRGLPSHDKNDLPSTLAPPSTKQPCTDEFPALGCRLCMLPSWSTWKNTDGQTKTIRNHLETKHRLVWEELVLVYKLKGWEKIQERQSSSKASESEYYEPFSLRGFNDRLLSFMAADDQSISLVECEEFRELLEFICPALRDPGALPHRTKLGDDVSSGFERLYESIVSDIENSLGRVSFTSDVWSRQNLQSYMAVTAHYLANLPTPAGPRLSLETRLIAFRVLYGSHTGANLGEEFMKILEQVNCVDKISMITLDNASNNQTMCAKIEAELHERGIAFDREGNRVRCFPHVINIAVQTGLKHFTKTQSDNTVLEDWDAETDIAAFSNNSLMDDMLYFEALRSDVVSKCRRTVNWCRASGQRRDRFSTILREGNKSGGWGSPKQILRDLQLKNDCDTRWSSLFSMVDTFLELYPVISKLISENPDLTEHMYTEAEISVLRDIRVFLQVFHYVQELVSAEKTPTLSLVLPLYEILVSMLKDLAISKPKLVHAINASIAKLEEYLNISRGTKMYILAMVLNPKIKFSWLKENWSPSDYALARSTVTNALSEFEKATRGQSRNIAPLPARATRRVIKSHSVSSEASAQANGYERLINLRQDLRKSASLSSLSSEPESGALSDSGNALSAEELAMREDEAGLQRVEAEIKAYEEAGLADELAPLDLLQFWQDHMTAFPLLYRIALDVLPAQASAVPCERVFSSSKETDTNRRSNLSPERMEQLQILKFRFRGHRLSFADGTDRELSVLDLSPDVIKTMYERGDIAALEKYITDSWNTFLNTSS